MLLSAHLTLVAAAKRRSIINYYYYYYLTLSLISINRKIYTLHLRDV